MQSCMVLKMFKHITVLSFLFIAKGILAMGFNQIVEQNLSAPEVIVEQLREWQKKDKMTGKDQFPHVAQAFLDQFGGESFSRMEESVHKGLQPDEEEELREIALRIGDSLYKIGNSEFDNVQELEKAEKFLAFYYSKQNGGSFADSSSSSVVLDKLRGMIETRREYIDSVEQSEKHLNEKMDEYSQLPKENFDSNLLDSL